MALLFSKTPGSLTYFYHFDDLYFNIKGSRFKIVSTEKAGIGYLDSIITVKNVETKVLADFTFRNLVSIINRHSDTP